MINLNKQKLCVHTIHRTEEHMAEKHHPPCAQTKDRASRTYRGVDVRIPTPKHETKTRQKYQDPDIMPGTQTITDISIQPDKQN